jgi:hypothetical protein
MLMAKLLLERMDGQGRLLETRAFGSRSFVKNFISLLYIAHSQGSYGMNDIDGVGRTVDADADSSNNRTAKANLKIAAAPGNCGEYCTYGQGGINQYGVYPHQGTVIANKIGIQVGTGTAAVTPNDNALGSRISHGRAAGELEYGGCELIGLSFTNPNGELTIRRYFTNVSGGSITVNEVGIHAVGTNKGNRQSWSFLVARDPVSPGIAVATGEILRVTYVVQITV